MKKELQKKLSFVLFVMAVFFAGVALTVGDSSVLLICVAGVLLLAATVFFALQPDNKSQTPSGKASEILLADRMAELMRGNEKAEKGVYIAVKKQHEAMEAGLVSLEAKLSELIAAQENAVKTIVLYNKENAKQMALSEREELSRLREELVEAQQGGKEDHGSMEQVVDAVKEMSRRLYEEFHENGEAILAELETTADSLEEIKEMVQGMENGVVPIAPMPVVTAVPEPVFAEPVEESEPEPIFAEPEEMNVPQDLFEAEEVVAEEELFVPEESFAEPVEEDAPAILEDSNRMLSADDIAALFAAAEPKEEPEVIEEPIVVEEPVEEEAPKTKNPEDALASSGVDLSDPNKTLSPDDIAALIAALGN